MAEDGADGDKDVVSGDAEESRAAEPVDDDADASKPGAAAGEAAGRAATSGMKALLLAPWAFITAMLRVMPGSRHIWRGLAKACLKQHYRNHGGDRTGLTYRPNGQVELEPVKWDPGEDDLKTEPGYQSVRRDKTFAAGADGRADERLGKVPIVLLDEDFATKGSMIESRVMEAIELDNDRRLFSDPTITKVEVDYDGQRSPQAVADGGVAAGEIGENQMTTYRVEEPGELADVLVDIGSGEGFDGQAVSFDRFTDKFEERAPTERLQMAEQRGYLAGMDPSAQKGFVLKVMLIAAAVAIAGLIGPELIGALFGGGGGGSLGGLSLTVGVI